MKLLVIIPAYNEQDSIKGVVDSLLSACPNADYIIINDCSSDNTNMVCRENKLNHINLPVNLGIGGGVQTGYKYAVENGYDITVQLDGDGQHDPAYISRLIKPLLEGTSDMVIGSRFVEKSGFQSSATRRLGIVLLKWLIHICCGVKISDVTSGFRACSKRATAFFADQYAQDYPEPEAIISAVINGFAVSELPVVMRERKCGKSSISSLKSVYYMIKVSLSIVIYRLSNLKKVRG